MNRGNQLRVLGLKKYDLSLPNDYCRPDWDYNEEIVWNAFKPILIDAVVEQLKQKKTNKFNEKSVSALFFAFFYKK